MIVDIPLSGTEAVAGVLETAPVEVPLLVAIYLDGRRLLLPQREVFSLESVLDVRRGGVQPPAAGVIELVEEEWPVYCLSGETLTPALDFPSPRRICLLLSDGYYRLAIVCDQVETLAYSPRAGYPLPPCLAKPGALIERLVVHGETVGCMTTTARLAAYCQRDTDWNSRNG